MSALEIIGALALAVVIVFTILWTSGLIEISVEDRD